jgi:hypothetical protein
MATGTITAVNAGTGLTGGGTGSSVTLSVEFGGGGTSQSAARSDHNHNTTYWRLAGNSGTTSGTHFLGTTDDVPLELRVNSTRALRLVPSAGTPNLVGGYGGNSVGSAVKGAVVAGGGASGKENKATGDYSTIGGGWENTVSDILATVAGGCGNLASGFGSAVGGGCFNTASNERSVVAGGYGNTASGLRSAVGGGLWNRAEGTESTVPGGSYNWATGNYAFAAGRRAKAGAQGCFAWADSTDADFTVSDADRFAARAGGGVYFYTTSSLTAGSYLAAGSGSWASVSDRNVKERIVPVDEMQVLKKLASVPISTWSYATEQPTVRHMGPMAQDLYATFALGDSDKSIATVDADGVALAAIQGLYQLLQKKDAEISDLKARLARLEALLDKRH